MLLTSIILVPKTHKDEGSYERIGQTSKPRHLGLSFTWCKVQDLSYPIMHRSTCKIILKSMSA